MGHDMAVWVVVIRFDGRICCGEFPKTVRECDTNDWQYMVQLESAMTPEHWCWAIPCNSNLMKAFQCTADCIARKLEFDTAWKFKEIKIGIDFPLLPLQRINNVNLICHWNIVRKKNNFSRFSFYFENRAESRPRPNAIIFSGRDRDGERWKKQPAKIMRAEIQTYFSPNMKQLINIVVISPTESHRFISNDRNRMTLVPSSGKYNY